MGRLAVSVADDEQWVFNRLAEHYHARPVYPEALVQRLLVLAEPDCQIVDIGAGTGLLTMALAAGGAHLTAVEPARAMLTRLRRRLPTVRAVHAAAEGTGLVDKHFSLAVLADVLHWIDAQRAAPELARILRPHGVMAVIEVAPAPSRFQQELAHLLMRYNPKARGRSSVGKQTLLRVVEGTPAGAVSRFTEEHFAQAVPLEKGQLAGILRSLSYVGPALGEAKLDMLLREAERLWVDCGCPPWARQLTLSWTRSIASA